MEHKRHTLLSTIIYQQKQSDGRFSIGINVYKEFRNVRFQM